ncbi:MAG: hypothetical protein WA874_14510 [Chryseosolibacter sp.]
MRSLLPVFVICFLIPSDLDGQPDPDRGKEWRVGYGILSDVRIIAAFAETYSTIASGISGEPLRSDYASAGPVIIRCDLLVSRRISLGPEINFVQIKRTEMYSSGEVSRDRFFFANLSARIDYYYVNRESVRMYSGLALGPSYIFDRSEGAQDDSSGFFVAYQLNFFGIRFGREWGGYAEAGFGRNGLLNVGISKQF